MPGIVEFPQVVQDAVARYGALFHNECQRRHFAEYLTGLIVAQRKTVLGIHDEFARTTDQSCLNRFLTAAEWDAQDLNRRRLDELQEGPSTRYSDHGVIPIDNTLIDRDGLLIPDAGWFWDHAEGRHKGYGQELCSGIFQAAGFSLMPSTKTVPLTTSTRSGEPFNDRQPFDADSISLNTIVRHATRLPLPLVLS